MLLLNHLSALSLSPPLPLPALESEIQRNGYYQRNAETGWSPVVVEFCGLASTNRAATVDVRAHGIGETGNGYQCKSSRNNESGLGGLGAKIE